jgi:hypothetical protein
MNSENICCLCGLRKADTKEHIFPKGFFNPPRPRNLPTIPACYECNNRLSKDEEDFRMFLNMGMAYESNAGKRIWKEKILPDLKAKRSRMKQRTRSMVKLYKYVDKSRNVDVYVPIVEINRDSANRVLRKIAKGLYHLDTQRVLPSEIEILVGYYAENPDILSPPLDEAIRGATKVELGQGEVTYWRNTMKDNPEESLTWIRFYKDKIFLVCTTRQDASLG